ncbi:MAG: hypothetical protein RLY93_12205 [Sumerlaeia bacterium]
MDRAATPPKNALLQRDLFEFAEPVSTEAAAPALELDGLAVCFTGWFAFGGRKACMEAARASGAAVHLFPVRGTDLLVVGALGSRTWLHGLWGAKIERARVLKNQGHPIRIVTEAAWVSALRVNAQLDLAYLGDFEP